MVVIGKRIEDRYDVIADVLEHPGRVRPVFQSIVDLQRGEVCGYEALARFTDHPGLAPSRTARTGAERTLPGETLIERKQLGGVRARAASVRDSTAASNSSAMPHRAAAANHGSGPRAGPSGRRARTS